MRVNSHIICVTVALITVGATLAQANHLRCDETSQSPLHICAEKAGGVVAGHGSEITETLSFSPSISSAGHFQAKSARMRNRVAADLQKSWNDTSGVALSFGLRSLTQRQIRHAKRDFKRLRATHTHSDGSNAILPNVAMDSLTVLGRHGGLTVAAWKDGPVGTMPFMFHFDQTETQSGNGFVERRDGVSLDFRGVLKRSAKIWSRRLVHTGPARDVTVEDGTTYRDVDGFLLEVRIRDGNRVNGGVRGWVHGPDGEDFIPYHGFIGISKHVHDKLHDGMPSTVAHEIGHALGIVSAVTKFYANTEDNKKTRKYYQPEAHTWTGPNAMKANDGNPVPMQWRDENQWWVVKSPHEEGAERDLGHLGDCASLMAYCRDDYDGGLPSELDFGFLADIGFDLVDSKEAAETERYGYATWGDWAAWGVSVERDLRDNLHEFPHDFTQAYANSFGTRPTTLLADNAALRTKSTATWNGNLIGVDLGRKRLPPVTGDAALSVDLSTLDGTARFSNLRVHVGNARQKTRAKDFRKTELSYDIDVNGNSIGDVANRISGGFFGPAHQEVAGVLNDTRPEVNLLAGFGGIRDDE